MVQRQDILHGLNPRLREKTHPLVPSFSSPGADPELSRLGFSEQKGIQKLKEHLNRPMAEFMVPPLVTADVDDPILLVTDLMIDHGLTFVPVMRSGEIVGLIYFEDALREVMASID
jgi:predicted transcriptional regulator